MTNPRIVALFLSYDRERGSDVTRPRWMVVGVWDDPRRGPSIIGRDASRIVIAQKLETLAAHHRLDVISTEPIQGVTCPMAIRRYRPEPMALHGEPANNSKIIEHEPGAAA